MEKKEFKVIITETLSREIILNDVASAEEALKKAQDLYGCCDIVLDYSDHENTEFEVYEFTVVEEGDEE